MTTLLAIPRRFFVTAAAFGLATLGIAGAASAEPAAVTLVRVEARSAHGYRGDAGPDVTRYDLGRRDRRIDPHRRAMWRHDRNRNGRIDVREQRGFWQSMAVTGLYGNLSAEETARFVQLAPLFDTDKDGRLVGAERTGMDRLVSSLRQFKRLDRNGDRRLSAFEVGFSSLAPRFYRIDANRDRRLTQQEVRDDVLRSFRRGERG